MRTTATKRRGASTKPPSRDPPLAMAVWGIALADGPDLNTPVTASSLRRAAQHAHPAATLAANATPLEQRLIESWRLRFAERSPTGTRRRGVPQRNARARATRRTTRTRSCSPPKRCWNSGGLTWRERTPGRPTSREPRSRSSPACFATIPRNVMANHLCVHLYDLAPDRTPGTSCAQRLDAAAFPPEAEHLTHMPAHYWIETGRLRRRAGIERTRLRAACAARGKRRPQKRHAT